MRERRPLRPCRCPKQSVHLSRLRLSLLYLLMTLDGASMRSLSGPGGVAVQCRPQDVHANFAQNCPIVFVMNVTARYARNIITPRGQACASIVTGYDHTDASSAGIPLSGHASIAGNLCADNTRMRTISVAPSACRLSCARHSPRAGTKPTPCTPSKKQNARRAENGYAWPPLSLQLPFLMKPKPPPKVE